MEQGRDLEKLGMAIPLTRYAGDEGIFKSYPPFNHVYEENAIEQQAVSEDV